MALLAAGFPDRNIEYWRRGLARLGARSVPDGYPRYGYVMADGERLVGIILVIGSTDAEGLVRGNLSSWCVDPAYRGFSGILAGMPLKLKGATLFNISAAPETHATIEAQGFRRYVEGSFHAPAFLAPPAEGARLAVIGGQDDATSPFLAGLARQGCLCFVVCARGETLPFAFIPTRIVGGRFRAAQLVYCRETEDFVRVARPARSRAAAARLPDRGARRQRPDPRPARSLRRRTTRTLCARPPTRHVSTTSARLNS